MNVNEIENQLTDRRLLLERLNSAAKESLATVDLDQSRVGRLSRMDAMQMQAMAKEEDRRRKLELLRIDTALERLKAGDFGYCVICDEAIAPKRLALDPALPTCIQCARDAEQK